MIRQLTNVAGRAAEFLSLEGKVAVVTGAASGIGRGVALRLSEFGASVAVLDIHEANGDQAAGQIRDQNGEAVFLKCDVRSVADCRKAVEAIMQK